MLFNNFIFRISKHRLFDGANVKKKYKKVGHESAVWLLQTPHGCLVLFLSTFSW